MFTRTNHILRRNHSNEFPRNWIFFDTETRERKGDKETELVFDIGSACHWVKDDNTENWIDFGKIKTFWDFVFSKLKDKTTLYVVAHNLPFDFRIVKGFAEMKRRKMKQEKVIYDGTTNIFSFSGKHTRLVFMDSMNFFKTPLAVLGKNIGLEKLDMKTDDLKKYNRRDVEILVKAWKLLYKFIADNDLGNFKPTIAGQAFNAFRHRFMNHPIFIHTYSDVIQAEREAYHGGRTECFRIGKIPGRNFKMYDVNSMYPFVMKTYDYPVKFIGQKFGNLGTLKKALKNYCVIARVRVKTKEPVFCYKREKDGKLIFPVGTFDTTLTTRELEYAVTNCKILKVYKLFLYRKKNIFSGYVDFFYSKKQEYDKAGNASFRLLTKLFLNSLYGKFGQRNSMYEPCEREMPEDGTFYDVKTGEKFRRIAGVTEKFVGKIEGFDSLVAIPAHITADARMILWNYIKSTGNVYYCDTDSIITDKEIETSKELGGMSLKAESDILKIYGNKDYVFGKEEVIKGIKKNAELLVDGSYNQIQFEGLAGAIKKNRIDSVFIKTVNKTLYRNYDKGIVLASGKILPHRV